MWQRRGGGPRGLPAAAPDPLASVGAYTVVTSLRRDARGEVCVARGPRGDVRLRLVDAGDPARLDSCLDTLGGVRHPALAPVLERIEDQSGGRALVAPLDALTLADRRRRGRLPVEAVVSAGAVLLDGLAALHEAGVVHGGVDAHAAGVDEAGAPRWQDACLWASGRRSAPTPADDVRDFAVMVRGLARLPPDLASTLDRIVTAEIAGPSAAELAAVWRALAGGAGLTTPPRGVRAEIAALLPPPPRPPRRLPPWLRAATSAVLLAGALGLIPAARLVPGGGPAFAPVAAYLPDRTGEVLTYRVTTRPAGLPAASATTRVRVAEAGILAGQTTVSLENAGPQGTATGLPFGLGGGTIRVEAGDTLRRTVAGGSVRDLAGPLRPGGTWQDTRTGEAGFVTQETRTVLGPAAVSTAAGSYTDCVALTVSAASINPAVRGGVSASGLLWLCRGVGLARAVLQSSQQESVVIELVSAG